MMASAASARPFGRFGYGPWTFRRPAGCVAALLALWLALVGRCAAANIDVTADRNPVSVDETFNLVFSADEEPDGDPDFAPLRQDFEIVRQGKSTQVSVTNGRFEQREEWTVTVMAKRPGTLTVPPLAFGSDRSRPLTLTALPGRPTHPSQGDPLILEVEAEPKNPYVQAQVLYTVRLLHRVSLRAAELSDPTAPDALIEKLGNDRRYQAQRDGHPYTVIERRFALFPQKSGALHIEPMEFEAQLSAGPQSLFSEFFGQSGPIRRLRSAAIDLEVQPRPGEFTSKTWLPAESVQLAETWSHDPPATRAGEPITRTLTLRAEGAPTSLLPELVDSRGELPGLKQYPDQPALNEERLARGVISVREEKVALLPAQAGTFRLPPVEVSWWNTKTHRMDIARLPERLLAVEPGAQKSAEAMAPEPVPSEPEATPDSPQDAAVSNAPFLSQAAAEAGLWLPLALIFAAGWVATAFAWWYERKHRTNVVRQPSGERAPAASEAARALRHACDANDPNGARRALLAWARLHWREKPPHSLEDAAHRLGGVLAKEIEQLNAALYAPQGTDWQGAALRKAFESATDRQREKAGGVPGRSELEPLYRH